jgi:hypothetical protein
MLFCAQWKKSLDVPLSLIEIQPWLYVLFNKNVVLMSEWQEKWMKVFCASLANPAVYSATELGWTEEIIVT